MKSTRLLLVEDNQLLRDGIFGISKKHKDVSIIARWGDVENTLINIKEINPTVILIDLDLLSQKSFQVAEIVKNKIPSASVIITGLEREKEDILQYVQANVKGFIMKKSSLKDYLLTIRKVDSGSAVLPKQLINSLFAQIVGHEPDKVQINPGNETRMTLREKELMQFLSEGMTNKEIGSEMQISTYTVKSHIHNIMEKLSVHTRLEIANYYYGENIN
jgi:DNA-binding NarL/FixJ family response regulator